MVAKFYERYVPPPKVFEDGAKPDVRTTSIASDRKAVPRDRSKIQKNLKRSAAETSVDHRPKKRVSPKPHLQSPELGTEVVTESEVAHSVDNHGLTPLNQFAQPKDESKVSISSALPGWVRDPMVASSTDQKAFEEVSLSRCVKLNLSKGGFSVANGLQCRVLPMLLPNHSGPERYRGDICISAATGSGKTLAYALPLIESLRDKPVTRLRGLIVVPTRELVLQARKILDMVAAGTGIKTGVAVGSNRFKDEQESLMKSFQRWSPEASRKLSEDKIQTEDELMDWDLDYAESRAKLDCQPDHVSEYASNIDVLICTPGRLVDHINHTKGFHLHHITWLVIDEADRLLDESFQEWVAKITPQLEHASPNTKWTEKMSQTFGLLQPRRVQKIILSATMTKELSKLISLRLNCPKMVLLGGATEFLGTQERESGEEESIKLPDSLVEVAMAVTEANYKPLYVTQLLLESADVEMERHGDVARNGDVSETKVTDDSEASLSDASFTSSASSSENHQNISRRKQRRLPGTLVFAKSNESALRLARLLSILLPQYRIRALTKSPGDRKGRETLSMFRRGNASVVVATDLASRGLDIPQLSYVINYDMPTSLVSYVHRVGRTARAGRAGQAVTLVEHKEGNWFWNEIARTKGLGRARKVIRMDGGLRAGQEERRTYEDALRDLGREAVSKGSGN